MPKKTSSTADPGKLVGLLWAPSLAVGRTGLTLDAVVKAAVKIADTKGLDALSMRRLADTVGVGVMTLYTYVPGRAELLELMLDSVAQEVYQGRPLPRTKRSLRTAIQHIADCNWDYAIAHPWTVEVPPGRPIVGPGVCVKYERELEPLDGIGLTDHEMDHLLTTVLFMVNAAARWQISLERIRTDSALSDDQWWQASAPVLGQAMQGFSLPIADRVGSSVASAGDPKSSLQFGLTGLVDGITARLRT